MASHLRVEGVRQFGLQCFISVLTWVLSIHVSGWKWCGSGFSSWDFQYFLVPLWEEIPADHYFIASVTSLDRRHGAVQKLTIYYVCVLGCGVDVYVKYGMNKKFLGLCFSSPLEGLSSAGVWSQVSLLDHCFWN